MIGLTLVDTYFSRVNITEVQRDSATIDLIGSWLEQIVESMLVDINLLRGMDNEIGTGEAAFDRVIRRLHSAEFERWAREAKVVLNRIDWLRKRGREVAKAEELDDRYGRTMARLHVTPDDLDEANAQFARGEGLTIEEVRNELRAAARAKAQAGLAELDPWLQEETLDEIELLVERADRLVCRPGVPEVIHDFVRYGQGTKCIVFITVEPDHIGRILMISSVGHFAKPDSATAARSG